MTPNQQALRHLRTAPDSQVSPQVLRMVRECSENDPVAICELFVRIYEMPETERSRFVAAMVNPEWTSLPQYSKDNEQRDPP